MLVVTLAIARPRGGLSHEALRLLPDVLRLVRRRAGLAAVGRHWPGTPDGFAVRCPLTGLRESNSTP